MVKVWLAIVGLNVVFTIISIIGIIGLTVVHVKLIGSNNVLILFFIKDILLI